jgi:hypothetical protein
MHSQGMLGHYLSGPTHEQFIYYDALIQNLAYIVGTSGLVLSGLVLDFNCKFSAHARKHWLDAFKGMAFLIGWLHSKSGHKLDCQLGFCSIFKSGTGRLVGENMEQVWVSIIIHDSCILYPKNIFTHQHLIAFLM